MSRIKFYLIMLTGTLCFLFSCLTLNEIEQIFEVIATAASVENLCRDKSAMLETVYSPEGKSDKSSVMVCLAVCGRAGND